MTRLAAELGVWRSALGDGWPHGPGVEQDWWPQGTHLVGELPPLVVCATGGGGGSQQALFRAQLDPVLRRGHERWQAAYAASAPAPAELDRLFAAIQHELAALREPPWAEQLQASAVALLVRAGEGAVANVGVESAWRLRSGRLERISEPWTMADAWEARPGEPALSDGLRDLPGSFFGRFGPLPARWQVRAIELRAGDVCVLASGFRGIGVGEGDLETELEQLLAHAADETPRGPATWRRSDRAATQLGQRLLARADALADDPERRRARWLVHSRLALAVVRLFDGG